MKIVDPLQTPIILILPFSIFKKLAIIYIRLARINAWSLIRGQKTKLHLVVSKKFK